MASTGGKGSGPASSTSSGTPKKNMTKKTSSSTSPSTSSGKKTSSGTKKTPTKKKIQTPTKPSSPKAPKPSSPVLRTQAATSSIQPEHVAVDLETEEVPITEYDGIPLDDPTLDNFDEFCKKYRDLAIQRIADRDNAETEKQTGKRHARVSIALIAQKAIPSREREGLSDEDLNSLVFSLKALRLDDLELGSLDGVDVCNQLEEFSAKNNQITTVAENFDFLPRLRILDLSNNRLKSIEGLEMLTSLVSLNLANNRIEEIDIENFNPDLQILSMYGNPVALEDEYRPALVVSLEKLFKLDGVKVSQQERWAYSDESDPSRPPMKPSVELATDDLSDVDEEDAEEDAEEEPALFTKLPEKTPETEPKPYSLDEAKEKLVMAISAEATMERLHEAKDAALMRSKRRNAEFEKASADMHRRIEDDEHSARIARENPNHKPL